MTGVVFNANVAIDSSIFIIQGKEVTIKGTVGFAEDTELDQEGKPPTIPAGYSVEFTEERELRYAKP